MREEGGVIKLRRYPNSSMSHRGGPLKPCLVALLCTLMVSTRFWLPLVGGFLIVSDPLAPADALVPLAGDRARVEYAATLFLEGYAPEYVITDMWARDSGEPLLYATRVEAQAAQRGVAREHMLVAPGRPRTTREEAIIIRDFALAQGWRSLLIVTSPSHTRRARKIFRAVFASTSIRVTVLPVAGHWYTAHSWWKSGAGRNETALEYLKLIAYIVAGK